MRTLLFREQVAGKGLPEPVAELRFARPRRFKFDWAWPDLHLALEIEGGSFISGRHTRGQGFKSDIEKYNLAAVLGWAVLRALPEQVDDGTALDWILRLLAARGIANG
jgi:hypothetical protein